MAGGYIGKLLFIDLSAGKIKEETPEESLCRDFIGGYGVGARILYSRQKAGADSLGPENTLGIMTGPLTGTPTPLGCRYVVIGKSPLTGKIGLEISAGDTPLGICTSSGTVGHSLSYGKADAVVALSPSAALADAAATAICNHVSRAEDIDGAIEFGRSISGLKGLIIIIDDKIGVWGEIKLCETSVG